MEGLLLQTSAQERSLPINRLIIGLLSPILASAARIIAAQDANRKDADDIAAGVLAYVASVLKALCKPSPVIPAFPAKLIVGQLPQELETGKPKFSELKTIFADERCKRTREWLEFASPFMRETGEILASLDGDDLGVDDRIAAILIYGADVIDALLEGLNLPATPEALRG